MSVKHFNESDFKKEVLNSKENFLIDFYADWCGPCKAIAPIIEEISKEYQNINVVKINIDKNSELASKYNVMSIPTVMIFKQGKEFDRMTGLVPKEKITDKINNL